MDIACSNCKFWLRRSEVIGECRRRSPATLPGETHARWPQADQSEYCWEWRPIDGLIPKLPPGRPVAYTRETIIGCLSEMKPTDAPRTFDEVLAILRLKHPKISRPTAYRFLNALFTEGWFKHCKGYVRASGREGIK